MITKPPEEKSTETLNKLERSEKKQNHSRVISRTNDHTRINANIRQKRFQIPIHLGLGHEAKLSQSVKQNTNKIV